MMAIFFPHALLTFSLICIVPNDCLFSVCFLKWSIKYYNRRLELNFLCFLLCPPHNFMKIYLYSLYSFSWFFFRLILFPVRLLYLLLSRNQMNRMLKDVKNIILQYLKFFVDTIINSKFESILDSCLWLIYFWRNSRSLSSSQTIIWFSLASCWSRNFCLYCSSFWSSVQSTKNGNKLDC